MNFLDHYRQHLAGALLVRALSAKEVVDPTGFPHPRVQNLAGGWLGELGRLGLPTREMAESTVAWIEQWLDLTSRFPLTENPTPEVSALLAWPTVWLTYNKTAGPEDRLP